MSTKSPHTPDWKVERIALGELPPEELESARAQLQSESDGAERLARIAASNEKVLEAFPASGVASQIQRRWAKAPRSRAGLARPSLRWVPLVVGMPAMAALALFVMERPSIPAVEEQEVVRIKGLAPVLELYRKRGAQSEALRPGAVAHAGDVLQVRYQRAGRAFGLIVSVDGAGSVTQHLPHDGARSVSLHGSGAVALEDAYELDDAPGFERFFFITASSGFDAAKVLEAARALAHDPVRARTAPLELPQGLEQTSFLVEKDTP
jgi:hypothetical protein